MRTRAAGWPRPEVNEPLAPRCTFFGRRPRVVARSTRSFTTSPQAPRSPSHPTRAHVHRGHALGAVSRLQPHRGHRPALRRPRPHRPPRAAHARLCRSSSRSPSANHVPLARAPACPRDGGTDVPSVPEIGTEGASSAGSAPEGAGVPAQRRRRAGREDLSLRRGEERLLLLGVRRTVGGAPPLNEEHRRAGPAGAGAGQQDGQLPVEVALQRCRVLRRPDRRRPARRPPEPCLVPLSCRTS